MAAKPRIPKNPSEFNEYMNNTDKLQLTTSGTPPVANYVRYGWKPEESTEWTNFREQSNLLYAPFEDSDDVSKLDRLKMTNHIAKTRKYDNDKSEGHHLLDKVALNGTVDDCGVFNVVRGTSKAHTPVHHTDDPTVFIPELSFGGFALGQHVIIAVNSENQNRKLPDGMAFVQIFRCISATPPTKLSQYEPVGTTKRGIFRSNFPDIVPAKDEVLTAYYYGRYLSKKGLLGNPSNIIDAPVMLAKV